MEFRFKSFFPQKKIKKEQFPDLDMRKKKKVEDKNLNFRVIYVKRKKRIISLGSAFIFNCLFFLRGDYQTYYSRLHFTIFALSADEDECAETLFNSANLDLDPLRQRSSLNELFFSSRVRVYKNWERPHNSRFINFFV